MLNKFINAKEARRLSEEAKKTAVERYNRLVEAKFPEIFERSLDRIKDRASQGFYDCFINYTILEDTPLAFAIRPADSRNLFDEMEKELISLGFKVVYSGYSCGYVINWGNA